MHRQRRELKTEMVQRQPGEQTSTIRHIYACIHRVFAVYNIFEYWK